ncbi:hypothetical protein [Luteococcus sanguinis]|uniref:Uncharacterized protein n=1 Tax=Luteococcus sanguinis TaxID=174038 RepID=A0ABW1X0U8_9ACTN
MVVPMGRHIFSCPHNFPVPAGRPACGSRERPDPARVEQPDHELAVAHPRHVCQPAHRTALPSDQHPRARLFGVDVDLDVTPCPASGVGALAQGPQL